MIVPVAVRPQADNRRFGRLIILPRNLRLCDASPQPLPNAMVQGPSPSIHTHLHACGRQAAGKIAAGKLRAWIAMKELWRGCLERPRPCLHAEPTMPREGYRPRHHRPAAPRQHRDQGHTPRTPPDRRDIRTPDVLHSPHGPPAQQVRIDSMPGGRPARVRLGITRRHAHDPQPPRDALGMHGISLGLEPGRQAAHSLTWRPRLLLLQQAPQLKGRQALAHRSSVHPGSWYAQERTLPGHAELSRCRFDQPPLGFNRQVQLLF